MNWLLVYLFFFTDQFLSSTHPLVGHFRVALGRAGDLYGMIPMSAIAAYDMKVNNLCKVINPKAEMDPLLVLSLILKSARMSSSVCTINGELWISNKNPYSPETLQSPKQLKSSIIDCVRIEAIHIPCSMKEHVETLALYVSDTQYYMDEIAKKLGVRDSSRVLVSRTVGKTSSEMKLYFYPEVLPLFLLDSSIDLFADVEGNASSQTLLNKRASFLSGQNIYGDAILANVGYTWKSSDLFYEDVSLCTYYRMLLAKAPNGHYKLSREAILVAELPIAFTARSNWRGPSPRELLCTFCRQYRLSEPLFSVKCHNSSETPSELLQTCKKMKLTNISEDVENLEMTNGQAADGNFDESATFSCEVKLVSRRQDPVIECSFDATYIKESDAIQNAALKVLAWFNEYFKELDMPMDSLCSFGQSHNIKVYPQGFSLEFAACLSIYGVKQSCQLISICVDQPNKKHENGEVLFNIQGSDSGVFASLGSLICISYAVALVRKGETLKEPLESNDEFEFEVGTTSVINQIEACVTQLSVNQTAHFIIELLSWDLILAAAGESTDRLSHISPNNCFLEYSVKVLRVTEPLEDRMEKALFSPPLSKQRVEFAVQHINQSHATTLVDFGCGSGSLLASLLEHTTTLEKIVGVDISRKSLTHAAKILHSKLSTGSLIQLNLRSAMLYDGSITNFDPRLYGFDIGTCLEVIEHMEEDQACLFGNLVLSLFCPRVLIVSTPNYEYNPILQRSTSSNKEDDPEEKSAPCKFRNHDHKFEWTREQFERWATDLASRHDYSVEFSGVGGSGEVEPGFASQIAVFSSALQQMENKCLRTEESAHTYEVIWEWTNRSKSAL